MSITRVQASSKAYIKKPVRYIELARPTEAGPSHL
jgi:hypothetical protein